MPPLAQGRARLPMASQSQLRNCPSSASNPMVMVAVPPVSPDPVDIRGLTRGPLQRSPRVRSRQPSPARSATPPPQEQPPASQSAPVSVASAVATPLLGSGGGGREGRSEAFAALQRQTSE